MGNDGSKWSVFLSHAGNQHHSKIKKESAHLGLGLRPRYVVGGQPHETLEIVFLGLRQP